MTMSVTAIFAASFQASVVLLVVVFMTSRRSSCE